MLSGELRMGSLGDGDSPNDSSKTNPNDVFARADTQVFDSQFSPPPSPGNCSKFLFLLTFILKFCAFRVNFFIIVEKGETLIQLV